MGVGAAMVVDKDRVDRLESTAGVKEDERPEPPKGRKLDVDCRRCVRSYGQLEVGIGKGILVGGCVVGISTVRFQA